MAIKSVVTEAKQIQLAVELIQLGARLQVLEAETSLSRERLLKLYKEVNGYSPPKGMLPYSTDWFVTWMPNIHASIFVDIVGYLTTHGSARGIEAIVKAYKLYIEHCQANEMEAVLDFTRAWTLMRFCNSDMLRTVPCRRCGGRFVAHSYDLHRNFVCGLCHVPSRAGKTKKARQEELAAQELRAAA
jgi:flagellar transcriptional activator FlhC